MIGLVPALVLSIGMTSFPASRPELPPTLLVLRTCAQRECRLEPSSGGPDLFTQMAMIALRPESLLAGLASRVESETQGTPIAAAAGLLASSRVRLRVRTNQVQLALKF